MKVHAGHSNLFYRLRRIDGTLFYLHRFLFFYPQLLRRLVFYFNRHFIRINFYNFGRNLADLPSKFPITKNSEFIQNNSEARPITVNHIFPTRYPVRSLQLFVCNLSTTAASTAHSLTAAHTLSNLHKLCKRFTMTAQFKLALYFNSFNIYLI